jgi:hypothetical protein
MGMNSAPNGPESLEVTKEQVIEAYRKFVEAGVKSPFSLDDNDPDVKVANDLFHKWVEQGDAKVEGDRVASYEFNFEKTTFYVDAGFTDKNDLSDTMEYLDLDLEDVENYENADDPRVVELRQKMEARIKTLQKQLETTE